MLRVCTLLGALSILTACGPDYKPVRSTPPPVDVPDAALVAPCDTSESDPATNGDLAGELTHTRRQRDDCAVQVEGVAKWRKDAIARAKPAS